MVLMVLTEVMELMELLHLDSSEQAQNGEAEVRRNMQSSEAERGRWWDVVRRVRESGGDGDERVERVHVLHGVWEDFRRANGV